MTENEQSIEQLAEDYLSALESEADEEESEGARERLSELRERYERFKSDYGESDPATQELNERVQDAEEHVEQLEEAQKVPEEFEEQLLVAAIEFTLSEEWLEPEVIEALNRALIGERDSVLVAKETEISRPDDVTDVDDIVRFDIIDIVRKLAMDKLDGSKDVSDAWESIAGTTKERPFRIVAELGTSTPDEVLEHFEDDDVKRETVRGRLKNATRLDINPYIRHDGKYELSTPGKYLAAAYSGVTGGNEEIAKEPSDQNEENQATLNQTVGREGGGSNE